MISPYLFHHLYWKFHNSAPDGIDTESKWTGRPEDFIPEPIVGFGLNSIGNSFYAGLSMEILVRNLKETPLAGRIASTNQFLESGHPETPACQGLIGAGCPLSNDQAASGFVVRG